MNQLPLPCYLENMLNVLLEGMAVGMGGGATDVGDIPEILGYGEGKSLASPREIDRLWQVRWTGSWPRQPWRVSRAGGANWGEHGITQ